MIAPKELSESEKRLHRGAGVRRTEARAGILLAVGGDDPLALGDADRTAIERALVRAFRHDMRTRAQSRTEALQFLSVYPGDRETLRARATECVRSALAALPETERGDYASAH